ncbi:MAG: translocation/assembly module TamB domain-containing protein [Terriglobales bacterium]
MFHHEISLNDLEIEHPIVHLEVDRRGQNNLPQTPVNKAKSNTNIFDLAVKHFALTDGEVNYNDRKTPLTAFLNNLKAIVTFDSLSSRYSGKLSYDQGRLRYGQYAALPHSFQTAFRATRSTFSLDFAVMTVASSTFSLRGVVNNYSDPSISGDYHITIHTQDFASMSPSARPAGDVTLSGALRYHKVNDLPFTQCVSVQGQLGSDGLSVISPSGAVDLRRLRGAYRLQDGTLRVSDVAAESLGGLIRADLEMQNLADTPVTHAHATLQRISLRSLGRSVPRAQQRQIALAGTLEGSASASWVGNFNRLRAVSDMTIRAEAKNASKLSTSQIPVDGAVHATYDGSRDTLALRQTVLRIPSATLTANGEISRNSSLQLRAEAGDLHELAMVITALSPTKRAMPAISGSATFNTTIRGSFRKPIIVGQLAAQNLAVEGTQWKSASLSLTASPSQLTVTRGLLINARRGSASFDANVALHNWSYLPANPIHANVSIRQMPLVDLQHAASLHYPISGNLSAQLSLHGSQLNPSGTGTATIDSARVYDEDIKSLALHFQASDGSIASTLHVATVAGNADAQLAYTPRTRAYKAQIDAPAITLQKLRTIQAKDLGLSGTLSLSANGEGTLAAPEMTATIVLPKLSMKQGSITGFKAEAHVANNRASFTLSSEVDQASVRARGSVDLTGDHNTDASIDTGSVPLQALLASVGKNVSQDFHGQTELHATLKGPLKDKTRIEAHVTIPTLNAHYQQLDMGAVGPIHADYSHSVITIQPADIRGTDTSVHIPGTVPLAGSMTPTLKANGSLDMGILRIFAPTLQSSGNVSFDLRASGSTSTPSVAGQIRVRDVAMSTQDAPGGVEKLNGTLSLNNDRLNIDRMTGDVGGGQVSMGGTVVYRPHLQFNLAVQGKSVRLRYPAGLRTLLDANLMLAGNSQASSLTGRVLLDSLSFTPEFDLASFADQLSSNQASATQPGIADTVTLSIAVQSKNNLSAQSSQVSIGGSANMQVTGTAANPVIIGRADLTSGELFYRNNRYELQRGIITFNDPIVTTPTLDVSVTTTIQQYNLTIALRGPFDRLTTSYVSDPPLASADIINLIAFGKTTSESAANSASQSTDSMIASGVQSAVGSEFSGGIQKLAGISSLQIDPLLGGNSQNPSAQIALQQRVTKNFLFTFSTDVSQPGEELVQGEYQINKRWSVSVTRNQVGGVSIDGRLHTKF